MPRINVSFDHAVSEGPSSARLSVHAVCKHTRVSTWLLSDITSNNQKESLPLIQKIYDTIGLPRNYGPSPQEEQEEQREDDDEERFRRQALEKAEEERRTSQWQEWVRSTVVH